jgi:LAS superfamily LD-carboxypeptidase LdcB
MRRSGARGAVSTPGRWSRARQQMRPDVAAAFDRMEAAARADGVTLIINSAFRSNAEQAALFARNPDAKWVAPPGRSLHRLGTELDPRPPAAYAWLAANGEPFHFTQRYSWRRWHSRSAAAAMERPDIPAKPGASGWAARSTS